MFKIKILSLFLLIVNLSFSQKIKTIHVFVALCDKENQEIVPVPARIGNGQDPNQNLYWGAAYGVKNYLNVKSKDWKLIKTIKNPVDKILERIVFKNVRTNTYLLADAYDGAEIKQTVLDFLYATSAYFQTSVKIESLKLNFGGASDLCAYIGHNGLMDVKINPNLNPKGDKVRNAIIISCYSKEYFMPYIKQTGANPLI